MPSPPEFEDGVYLERLTRHHVTNESSASGMFSQIDDLSLPGAGLRHLDFQSEMPSMFQGFFTGEGQSHMQVPPMPPSMSSSQSFVRTYGSEPEM
jgi:hypothetical protein